MTATPRPSWALHLSRRTFTFAFLLSEASTAWRADSPLTSRSTTNRSGTSDIEWKFIDGGSQGQICLVRDKLVHVGRRPICIYHHGAGGSTQTVTDPDNAYEPRVIEALAAQGYLVAISDFGGLMWGNDKDHRYINSLIEVAVARGGKPGPVAGVGISMGGGSLISYAGMYPAKIACVVGLIPVINLGSIRDAYPTTIDAVYAPRYRNSMDGPRHSPLVMAKTPHVSTPHEQTSSRFSGMPISLWFSVDDTLCTPTAVEQFTDRVNQRDDPRLQTHALAVPHGYEALRGIPTRRIVSFVEDHLPVASSHAF